MMQISLVWLYRSSIVKWTPSIRWMCQGSILTHVLTMMYYSTSIIQERRRRQCWRYSLVVIMKHPIIFGNCMSSHSSCYGDVLCHTQRIWRLGGPQHLLPRLLWSSSVWWVTHRWVVRHIQVSWLRERPFWDASIQWRYHKECLPCEEVWCVQTEKGM